MVLMLFFFCNLKAKTGSLDEKILDIWFIRLGVKVWPPVFSIILHSKGVTMVPLKSRNEGDAASSCSDVI